MQATQMRRYGAGRTTSVRRAIDLMRLWTAMVAPGTCLSRIVVLKLI
jgi:hypothetical protein